MMKEWPSAKPKEIKTKTFSVHVEYLPEKEVLKITLEVGKILEAIKKDFPEKLPSAVILPDTAARPLYYVFNEFFKKMAEKRGCIPPRFFFFPSFRSDLSGFLREIEKELEKDPELLVNQFDEIIDAKNKNEELEVEISQENLHKITLLKNKINKCLEDMVPIQENFNERAQEIKEHLPSSPDIIIIDHYISHLATNIYQIRKAFGENIRAYGLMSNQGPAEFSSEENIFVAEKDRVAKNDKKLTPGVIWKGESQIIGVVKNRDGKTAKKSREVDTTNLIKLRTDLKEIGHILAEAFVS